MEDKYSRWLPSSYTDDEFICPVCDMVVEPGPLDYVTIKNFRFCPFCGNRLLPPSDQEE